MRLMSIHPVASTPLGSSIEALGDGLYRVCDAAKHCKNVRGLWSAGELVREMEVRRRDPGKQLKAG